MALQNYTSCKIFCVILCTSNIFCNSLVSVLGDFDCFVLIIGQNHVTECHVSYLGFHDDITCWESYWQYLPGIIVDLYTTDTDILVQHAIPAVKIGMLMRFRCIDAIYQECYNCYYLF